MKRLLIAALSATTFTAGIGAADAAEVYFRYRGKMPTVIAAVEPEEPEAPSAAPGRLVSPTFVWDKGSMQAGDGNWMGIDIYLPGYELYSLIMVISNPDSFTLSALVAKINDTGNYATADLDDLPFTASEEDGKLVLTTTATGSAACVRLVNVTQLSAPEASIGFTSVPEACGTQG